MKKFLKFIGMLLLAAVIAAAGYVAGQKSVSDITEMQPENTVEVSEPAAVPEKEEKEEVGTEVKPENVSSVEESWSTVGKTYSADGMGEVTLYTSAETYDDEIIWDDGQEWLLEVKDENGNFYTLFNDYVNHGAVYYDVVQADEGIIVDVYVFTGAGTTITKYVYSDGKMTEISVYDTGAVNRMYSTIPMYR